MSNKLHVKQGWLRALVFFFVGMVLSGLLASITIVYACTGYTSAPTLSFPGTGAGASATATLGTGASVTAVVGLGASASISGAYTNAKRMRFTLNNSLND